MVVKITLFIVFLDAWDFVSCVFFFNQVGNKYVVFKGTGNVTMQPFWEKKQFCLASFVLIIKKLKYICYPLNIRDIKMYADKHQNLNSLINVKMLRFNT